jgi:hypothetical protein
MKGNMVLVVIVEYKNIVPSSEDSEEVRELYLLYSYIGKEISQQIIKIKHLAFNHYVADLIMKGLL